MERVAVVFAVICLLGGCSRGHSDWFGVYEARAAVAELRAGPAAETTPREVQRVEALLEQAEAALADGRGDDVAQIAELTLLRARIAALGAAVAAHEEDVAEATATFAAANLALSIETQRLRDAESDLEAFNDR